MRRIVYVFILVLVVALSGCGDKKKEVSTNDSQTTKEVKKAESKVLGQLENMIEEEKNYDEIFQFVDEKIGSISKEEGDEIIEKLIEYRQKYIEITFENEYNSKEFQERLFKLNGDGESAILSSIYEKTGDVIIDKYIVKLQDRHCKAISDEGEIYFVDELYWVDKYNEYISKAMKDYIFIQKELANKKDVSDGALLISFNELYDRIGLIEKFIKNYPNSKHKDTMVRQYEFYLRIYFYGLDNTPIFEYNDGKINREVLKSYKEKYSNGEDSITKRILLVYIPLLEKNEYDFSGEIEHFLDGLFTSKEGQYLFEDTDFKGGYGLFRKGQFYGHKDLINMGNSERKKLGISKEEINHIKDITKYGENKVLYERLEDGILKVTTINMLENREEMKNEIEVKKHQDITSLGDHIYFIKTVGNGEDSKEVLVKYDYNGNKKEIYSDNYFTYTISPSEEYIAVNSIETIVLMKGDGRIVERYKDVFKFKYENEFVNFVGWKDNILWLEKGSPGVIGDAFYKIDGHNLNIKEYDTSSLSLNSEYDLNMNREKLVYSDYPLMFAVDQSKDFAKDNRPVNIYLYDLNKKENKLINTIRGREAKPVWLDDETIEYNDPNGYRSTYHVENEDNVLDLDKSGKNAINEFHPIVFAFKDKDGVFSKAHVLGGSKDGNWYSIYDFKMPTDFIEEDYVHTQLVRGGEKYRFYFKGEEIGKVTGDNPTLYISQASGESILSVKIPTIIENRGDFIIGINGDWNGVPRKIEELHVDKSYLVDLDNDGKNEKVYMEEIQSPDKEKAKKFQLYMEKEGNSIFVEDISSDMIYSNEYRVYFADLNGDSKMEVITVSIGHYMNVTIYELDNLRIKSVLNFYEGD
ncbi:MAG: hypothetical protein N4A57_08145 [Anaeromicrobium sp.]|uniref:hypothetical protein n=1 Tax=Anaeromicrobium sp. TaxID=1929132 RepID=UPI0025CF17DD|nr:hypothetical protein [Anaeromicrobium sp.]MCT4594222.1 hypothetical protein [Anaeromicrobium sp.]